jgi:hypothetical protein
VDYLFRADPWTDCRSVQVGGQHLLTQFFKFDPNMVGHL